MASFVQGVLRIFEPWHLVWNHLLDPGFVLCCCIQDSETAHLNFSITALGSGPMAHLLGSIMKCNTVS